MVALVTVVTVAMSIIKYKVSYSMAMMNIHTNIINVIL